MSTTPLLKIRNSGRLALDSLRTAHVVDLLRPAINLVAGATISRGLGFVAFLIAARGLGPQDFGRLTGLQAIVAVGAAVSGLGLAVISPKTIAYLRVTNPEEAGRVAGSLLAMTAAGGVLVVLISVLVGRPVLATIQVPGLVVAAAGLAAATALGAMQTAVLYGLEATPDVAMAGVVRGVLTMVAVGAEAERGLSAVVFALLVVEVALLVVTGALLVRPRQAPRLLVRFRMRRDDLRMVWHVGVPGLAGSTAVLPAMWLGQSLLSSQPGGLPELGLFGLAYRFYVVILFVPTAITPLVLPTLVRTLTEQRSVRAYGVVSASLALNVGLAGVLALVVAAMAPLLAGLGGSAYSSSQPLIVVLALVTLPAGINNVLGQMAISLGRLRAWLMSDLVLAGALALAAIVLVPSLRGVGLALAYLIGMVSTCVALVPAVVDGVRSLRESQ